MAAQPKTRSILQEAGDPSLHSLQATSAANNPPSIQGNLSHQEECCLGMHVQTPSHCNAHFDLQRTVVYVGAGGFYTKLTHYQEFLFKCQWIMICRKACNLCGKLVHNLVKSSCA
ncbi:unnamed protein product [Sphagnum troendelagicum]